MELGIFLNDSSTLWCNNLGATYLSINPVLHARTKHVELDYYFLRDCVAAKTLNVSFVSSKDPVADILTKPLSTSRFLLLRSSLTISQVPLASKGDVKEEIKSTREASISADTIHSTKTPNGLITEFPGSQ